MLWNWWEVTDEAWKHCDEEFLDIRFDNIRHNWHQVIYPIEFYSFQQNWVLFHIQN